MPDNIYDVKVGDKLTRDQILEAAGQPSSQTKEEEVVLAEERSKSDQNKDEGSPTQDDIDGSRDYRYPLDMDQSYPAHIVFQVIKIEGNSVFDATGIKKIYADSKRYLLGETEDASIADEAVTSDQKAQIIDDSNQKQKERVSYVNNTGGEPLGKVTLPLMSPLRYADVANYNSSASLGILGGAAEDALQGRNPFEGATQNGQLKTAAGALAGQMLANSIGAAAGGLAGGVVGKGLGAIGVGGFVGAQLGEGIAAASKSATRVAAAPNFRTLFENVGVRPFSFDFKMIATNAQEAREIKNIIKMFRTELYPEKIPIGASGVPLAYKFPNVFEIRVKNRFGDEPGFRFQRCYLKDVTTTFNEAAQSMYNDGQFIEASLSLQFIEIVALDKDKIREGY